LGHGTVGHAQSDELTPLQLKNSKRIDALSRNASD
jgi:hypothetical protein